MRIRWLVIWSWYHLGDLCALLNLFLEKLVASKFLQRTLHWRHNELDCISVHQPHDCLLTCLFRHRSNETSKLRVTGLCEGNSLGTGEFPAQKASNAENVSIWWRHHDIFVDTKERKKSCLTHWGRVMHKCVSKQTIIGSDNGLSPGRRQAIIWTNDGILLIRSLGTNFSEILSKNHTFSFKKMLLKMSSAKWQPSWLGLNVLTMLKIMTGCLTARSNYPINDDSTAVRSGLHNYTYSQCKWACCEPRSQYIKK